MTEFAVRDGVATVTVKDYAAKRMRELRQEFAHLPAPVTPDLHHEIAKQLPELAGAVIRAPSADGPLARPS